MVEVEHEELLDQALANGRGAILLLPHIGNWELFNNYLLPDHPFLALYRPPRLTELDEPIRRSRQRTGAELVPTTSVGLRRLYRGLEAGKLILILPDQEPLKRHGVFAPFFGIDALTMTLVGRLVSRFDSPAIFGFAERRPDGFFRVRFRPAPDGLGVADKLAAATWLNRGIEECVRSCPEQYMWSYKRFKTRPPGEAEALRSRLNLPTTGRVSYRALLRLKDLEAEGPISAAD